MASHPVNADFVKGFLRDRCGYKPDLIQDNYQFSTAQAVEVAAFAHRPLDARSACIAAIECKSSDPKTEVMSHRELGAPVVFACVRNRVQVWRPGRYTAKLIEPGLTATQLPRFFAERQAELTPRRIYEAKTLGRLPGNNLQPDLFVDTGLLPYAEGEIGLRLTRAVTDVVDLLQEALDSTEPTPKQLAWIFKTTFRLLAAKILKDKRVPGFTGINLNDLETVFQRVQAHYGSTEGVNLGSSERIQAIAQGSHRFQDLGSLRHLTTEALADVYERALIDKDTRGIRGTHGTPSYLVDYVVWKLAPWIRQIDLSTLEVFEPACGHAPFLVGMLRLLRSFDYSITDQQLSSLCRSRFRGIEIDRFALEIARLSLTVADVPNHNGWGGLRAGDMFIGRRVENEAKRCSVLLANPPFEGTKPLRMLQRTLPYLPEGAVFGVIMPAGLLYSPKNRAPDFRKWLAGSCQLAEVSLFSDRVFRFADQECAVLIGRKIAQTATTPTGTARLRRVREEDADAFKEDYKVTSDRVVPQGSLGSGEQAILWVPELEEAVWSWLRKLPRLGSIAELGQGLAHQSEANLPPGTLTVSSEPFPGSVLGFTGLGGDPQMHRLPPETAYVNLDPSATLHRRTGVDVGKPQVLLNYAPAMRAVWRLRAFVDAEGHPVTSRFITVRPKSTECTLEYLWALLISPVANAYAYTHTLKRDILVGTMRELPVPRLRKENVRLVTKLVRRYFQAAEMYSKAVDEGADELPLFMEPRRGIPSIEMLHSLLRALDGEILRLYDLPPRAEKKVLDLFVEKDRPGVPGGFRRYYRKGFKKAVPLFIYLSKSYQDSLEGKKAHLPERLRARFQELADKRVTGELSPAELEEYQRLQAEAEGADYAVQTPDNGWLEDTDREQDDTRRKLGRIASRLIDLSHSGSSSHANKTPTEPGSIQ